jgi:hypothetical protein
VAWISTNTLEADLGKVIYNPNILYYPQQYAIDNKIRVSGQNLEIDSAKMLMILHSCIKVRQWKIHMLAKFYA